MSGERRRAIEARVAAAAARLEKEGRYTATRPGTKLSLPARLVWHT